MSEFEEKTSLQNFEDDYETNDKINIHFNFSIYSIQENQNLAQFPQQNQKQLQRTLQIQPFIQFIKSGKLKLNFKITDLSNPHNTTTINSDISFLRKLQSKSLKELAIHSQSNSGDSSNISERKFNQYSNQDQQNTENYKNLSTNQNQQQIINLSTQAQQDVNEQYQNILETKQTIVDQKKSKKLKKNEEKNLKKQKRSYFSTTMQQNDTEEQQTSKSTEEKQFEIKNIEKPYKKRNQSSLFSQKINQQQIYNSTQSNMLFGQRSDRIIPNQHFVHSKSLNQSTHILQEQPLPQFENKIENIQSCFSSQYPYKVETEQLSNEQYSFQQQANPHQYQHFNAINSNSFSDRLDQYSYKNEMDTYSQRNEQDQYANKNMIQYFQQKSEINKYPLLNLSKISMTEQIKQESNDNMYQNNESKDKNNSSNQQSKNDNSEKNSLLNLSQNIIENNDQSLSKFSQGQSGADSCTALTRPRRTVNQTPKSLLNLPLMNELQRKKQNSNISISTINDESSPSHQKGIAVNMAKNILKGFMEYIQTTAKEEDLIEFSSKNIQPNKSLIQQPITGNQQQQEEQELTKRDQMDIEILETQKSKQENLKFSQQQINKVIQESYEAEDEERSNQKDENEDENDQQDFDSEEKNQFDSDENIENQNKKSQVEKIRKRFKKHYNSKMIVKPSNTKLLKLFQNNSFGALFKHYISSEEILNYIQTSNIQSKNVHQELIEKLRGTSYDYEKLQDILKTRVIKKYPYSKPLE